MEINSGNRRSVCVIRFSGIALNFIEQQLEIIIHSPFVCDGEVDDKEEEEESRKEENCESSFE